MSGSGRARGDLSEPGPRRRRHRVEAQQIPPADPTQNRLDRDLFGFHPAIPRRGATALTSELASLGLNQGQQPPAQRKQQQNNHHKQQERQQKQEQQAQWSGWGSEERVGNTRNSGINMHTTSPRVVATKAQKKPRKLMEINEISSFQYGAHGELVPIEAAEIRGTPSVIPAGPQSPLSRHIQMEEMRQQQQTMRGSDGIWKNGWGESDPWVSPAPIRQRVLQANQVWPKTDAAEQQIMQDLASLDYALEANRRKQLRSTRSEPNGRGLAQPSLFVSKQRRAPIATAAAGARRYPMGGTHRQRMGQSIAGQEVGASSPRNGRKPHRPNNNVGSGGNSSGVKPRGRRQQQPRERRPMQQRQGRQQRQHNVQVWQRPPQQQQQWSPQYAIPQQQPYYGYGPSYGAGPAAAATAVVSQPFGDPYFQQPFKSWMR